MSIYSNIATKTPYAFGQAKSLDNNCLRTTSSNYIGLASSCFHFKHTRTTQTSSGYIGRVSKHNQIYSPVMEGWRHNLDHVYEQEGGEEYSKELDFAVRAVQIACFLCRKMQQDLTSASKFQEELEDHSTLITIADWSVRSIVSLVLNECMGNGTVSILAEQDVKTLSNANASLLLEAITETVNECLAEAPRFGLKHTKSALSTSELLEVISSCNSTENPTGRFWALDPVGETLGFLHGDQYAVSLALIEDGEVVLGVLGCPNYPMRKEWLSYHHRYHRIMSNLTSPTSETWDKGCVLYARKGSGKAWMQQLLHENKTYVWPNSARPVRLSVIENSALATFCDPVETQNSSHSFASGLAHSVGLRKQPLRVCNMVKYAALARGDAEIFMKFGRAGKQEKLRDHAAGVIIIQEAGGVVTDTGGNPLDFSKGLYLEGLDRGIVACAGPKLHDEIMEAIDASWNSSCL